jgi:alpha-L-rhamnosidase
MTSPPATAERVLIERDPFLDDATGGWSHRAEWPAHWIGLDTEPPTPFVAGYRLSVQVEESTSVRLHVSADERYELYIDGVRVGRGPDRGDLDNWNFETYDLTLPAGQHWLAARVWSIGAEAPFAQFSHAHGFLLAAQGVPELSTGVGAWESAVLPGHGFRDKGVAWGCGLKVELDGRAFPWGWEVGADAISWQPFHVVQPAVSRAFANDLAPNRLLVPVILPPQCESPFPGGRVRLVADFPGGDTHTIPVRTADTIADEAADWQQLLSGGQVTVPAHTNRRVLIDLEQYVCAYPVLRLQGGEGAAVRVHWQEGLFDDDGLKGNRDEIEGKRFRSIAREEDGVGDRFIAGGGDERHTTLWWEAGRYVEVTVETADEPLTIVELVFDENRYPYTDQAEFACADPRLARVKQLGFRTLQMCSHETTMDCPFYEQLQYAGDTRIQCLVAYVCSDDDRLARQALLAFDRSRSPRGLTTSRYPSRVRQTIPPFSLWWIAMVHDFALWRGDLEFVRSLMPGVRAVLDAFRTGVDADGIFHALDGWNFTDWVDAWPAGAPPGAHWDVSGILNFQLAHVAGLAAELEDWLGEDQLAARQRDLAARVLTAAEDRFWSAERGLFADDLEHAHWSEHAQCLALLAGARHGADAVERTLVDDDIERTTVYFDHYLFEAFGRIGRTDALLDRMGLWLGLLDSGLRTVIEKPEPSRSDCHAWGAHPIFHLYATILGVRPTSPGMATVRIQPQLGGLDWAEGTLRTPHGPLHVRVDADGTAADLPPGVVQS